MNESKSCGNIPVMCIAGSEARYLLFQHDKSVFDMLEESITQVVENKLICAFVSEPPCL